MEEKVLSFEERLGLAYLRLNNWKWDELLGEKPPGFDSLPNVTKRNVFGKRKPCKYDYTAAAMKAICEVCPIAPYFASRDRYDQSKIEWFRTYAPLRLISLLAERGVLR